MRLRQLRHIGEVQLATETVGPSGGVDSVDWNTIFTRRMGDEPVGEEMFLAAQEENSRISTTMWVRYDSETITIGVKHRIQLNGTRILVVRSQAVETWVGQNRFVTFKAFEEF